MSAYLPKKRNLTGSSFTPHLADSVHAPVPQEERNFRCSRILRSPFLVFPGREPEKLHEMVVSQDETLLPKVTDLNIVISGLLTEHVTKHAPKTPTMLLPVIANTTEFATNCQGAARFRNKWKLTDKSIVAYVGGTLESRRCQVSN